MVFTDEKNLLNKSGKQNYLLSNNGTKVCEQKYVIVY